MSPEHGTSARIRYAYTRDYYTTDCGGFSAFGNDDALGIMDPRLRVVAAFSEVRGGARALDVGCGRGEISAYLAARGWAVDAFDYSPDAVELAREHLHHSAVPLERVNLSVADVNDVSLPTAAYDWIVAADLVEHLGRDEFLRMLQRLRVALAPAGLLVIHTFPNLWYYRYGWPRRRRAALARGENAPEDPRSDYERLMHINEQSPKQLLRDLRDTFPFCEVWLGDALDPFRANVVSASRGVMRDSADLFAFASHGSVDDVVRSEVFSHEPLAASDRAAVRLAAERLPGAGLRIRVNISNGSSRTLSSAGRTPVLCAYHLVAADGAIVVYDGERLPLGPPIRAGAQQERILTIRNVSENVAIARVSLVQEGVAWFDGDGVWADVNVR